MNKVIITGRFTREPEIRRSTGKDGQSLVIARGTIAVNRRGIQAEGEQTADFPSIVAFGYPAEFIEKWAHQGMKFEFSGRLQTGSYTDRDGKRVYTTDVIVEEVEFAERKNGSGAQKASDQQAPIKPKTDDSGFMQIPDSVSDDGLPFN